MGITNIDFLWEKEEPKKGLTFNEFSEKYNAEITSCVDAPFDSTIFNFYYRETGMQWHYILSNCVVTSVKDNENLERVVCEQALAWLIKLS